MIARALVLGLTAALGAQTPPAPQPVDAATPRPATAPVDTAGAAKLKQALSTTAQLPSCAFTASWGPADKNNNNTMPGFPAMGGGPGDAKGLWHGDLLQLEFGDDDTLLCQGRRTIARDQNSGWVVRAGRFADGNKVPFLPEPAQLLATLATMDLAVTHREAGSLDDRPVEIATVELTADQYADLAWASLLPEPAAFGGRAFFMQIAGNGAGGARPAMPKPEATVDLACHFDPATGLLRRLHVRSYHKNEGQGQVFVVGGAGRVRLNAGAAGNNNGEDEDNEEPAAQPPAAGAPPAPQWRDGLPVRPKKKLQVDDFVLDFAQHGAARLPELDAVAKKLLGR